MGTRRLAIGFVGGDAALSQGLATTRRRCKPALTRARKFSVAEPSRVHLVRLYDADDDPPVEMGFTPYAEILNGRVVRRQNKTSYGLGPSLAWG